MSVVNNCEISTQYTEDKNLAPNLLSQHIMDRNVISEMKDELWEGEHIETFKGRRDNGARYNYQLFNPDGSRICTIELNQMKEKGSAIIDYVKYRLEHSTGSGKWELTLDGRVICDAVKPNALRTKLLLNEFGGNGSIAHRLRMQPRISSGQNFEFYEISTFSTNKAAMKDGKLIMSITSAPSTQDWHVTKPKDFISNVFLGFSYFMFIIMHRRRSDEYLGKFGFNLDGLCLVANFFLLWVYQRQAWHIVQGSSSIIKLVRICPILFPFMYSDIVNKNTYSLRYFRN